MIWVLSDNMQSDIAKYKVIYQEITYRMVWKVLKPGTGIEGRSNELEVQGIIP